MQRDAGLPGAWAAGRFPSFCCCGNRLAFRGSVNDYHALLHDRGGKWPFLVDLRIMVEYSEGDAENSIIY